MGLQSDYDLANTLDVLGVRFKKKSCRCKRQRIKNLGELLK